MKKLLFVDIDGTIARDTGKISETTKKTLKKFENIVLTTGRARSEVKKICDELGFRYFISSYGTELYDNHENKVLYNLTLDSNVILKIYELALNNNLSLVAAIEDKEIEVTKENYINYIKNVKQCMIKGSNEKLNVLRKKIKEFCKIKYQRDNAYENGYYWFSILPKDANKGTAAEYLMKLLNIDAKDTMAFGNDANDLPLFVAVSGNKVAVANSCEELKRNATIIIGDNNTDSVKKYLQCIIS